MKAIFLICGVISVAFVLFISVYLVISGIPAIRQIGLKAFLLGKTCASHSKNLCWKRHNKNYYDVSYSE